MLSVTDLEVLLQRVVLDQVVIDQRHLVLDILKCEVVTVVETIP